MDRATVIARLRGPTCRSLRWSVSSLAGTGDAPFGLDRDRGAGIDISTSEMSETPLSGSMSIGSSRWCPCAFPFALPFAGFNWGTADLRWDCLERDGADASSLSVRMIGSLPPWAFPSGLAWAPERLGAVGLRGAADFLAVMAG